MAPSDYDYATAGFDDFLSRSIDRLSQVNLDSQGPISMSVAYDRTQVSGMLGDNLQLGGITLGKNSISVSDGDNIFFFVGEE